MRKNNFRNIAIIAHVDHGKTTLVDGMLQQSGTFDAHKQVEDRVMDSMDLEKERGITIMAKNTAIWYKGIKINILDTPGHADFGGEVERSLNLVDGALLLVDASEGPLPQTRFVVKKALEKNLPIILVINKIDRPDARITEVMNEVYDLFIDLDANDVQIDFPVIYTVAKFGMAMKDPADNNKDLIPLFETILEYIPGPEADENEVPQFLVTSLDYDPYVGQMAVGRLRNGSLEMNKTYSICRKDGIQGGQKFSAIYTFKGLNKVAVDKVEAGDIIAFAGIQGVAIGDTVTSDENPKPLPRIKVDEPTVSMIFYVNDSPFAGLDGQFLTTRHLKQRLEKEMLTNVALELKPWLGRADAFEVSGRGELQMAILIETMRREGYELLVSKPKVITKDINGVTHEPVEHVYIDVPDEFIGIVTERLSQRKGRMTSLINHGHGRANLEFIVPSRGLIGFRSQFLTETKGAGILNSLFEGYEPWSGEIPHRTKGALVADREGKANSYAIVAMADRGELFIDATTKVYSGMIVGERNKSGDLTINITKEKKLTNMRSANSDQTVTIRPPRLLSLDQSIEFISDDELVEITPRFIRLRKQELDANRRKKLGKEQ